MINSIKRCLFCNNELTSQNKSVEHIIPKWLLHELDMYKVEIKPTHLNPNFDIISQRVHTANKFLSGHICERCNNGWMSKLEGEAQQLIIDLMNVRKEVKDLNDKERLTLARWTYKTALTLNSGSNYHKVIPLEHYHEFYNNNSLLPEKVVCLAQQHHEDLTFNWLQGAIWDPMETITDENLILEFKEKTYKTSFQFKSLILSVFYLNIRNFRSAIIKGIHIPLYPKKGKCGWYEVEDFNWNDSQKAIYQFHIGIKAYELK